MKTADNLSCWLFIIPLKQMLLIKTVYLHLNFQWANELCDTETLLWWKKPKTYTDVWEIIEELQTLELTLRSSRGPIMIWEGFLLRLLLCTFPLEERVTVKCILSGNDLLLDCLIWMKMMWPMHQPSRMLVGDLLWCEETLYWFFM